jgi:uncharacterized protein (TIGR03435 family)
MTKLALFVFVAGMVGAQAPLKFEVATVKLAAPERSASGTLRNGPDRMSYRNMTLKALVYEAFGTGLGTATSVRGGPDWIDKTRFDIEAQAAGNPANREFRAMLRALLEERFALKTHRADEAIDVYALKVDRSDGKLGPKVQEWPGSCANHAGPGDDRDPVMPTCASGMRAPGIVLDGATMFSAAEILSFPVVRNQTGRIVQDQTGLTGRYRMELEYPFPTPADATSIFTALREQWGLKLEPAKGTLGVVVIDGAAMPTEN